MKKLKLLTFFLLFNFFLSYFLIYNTTNINADNDGSDKLSNLDYKINYSLDIYTTETENVDLLFYSPIINTHNNYFFSVVDTLQEVHKKTISSSSSVINTYTERDIYNNSFDYRYYIFNKNNPINYNINYEVEINEIQWIINEENIGDFDNTSNFFIELTKSEKNIEVNNSELIYLSNSLSEGLNNITGTIFNIYTWIIENIEYSLDYDEIGAYQTYLIKKGDCSDYANLMIALLRIQGIPARKVIGLTITDVDTGNIITDPVLGDEWTYFFSIDKNGEITTNMVGHAWLEYYLPNYGFITVDPTWKFINYKPLTHLILNVGEKYGEGIEPYNENLFPLYEFYINPPILSTSPSIYFDFNIRFQVISITSFTIFYSTIIIFLIAFIGIMIRLFFKAPKIRKPIIYKFKDKNGKKIQKIMCPEGYELGNITKKNTKTVCFKEDFLDFYYTLDKEDEVKK